MNVYLEANLENGKEQYPFESANGQLRRTEEDFYQYLNAVFFRQEDSFYCIWEEKCSYLTALRLEPYRDGVLLCALETAPGARNQGYGTKLVRTVIEYLSRYGSGVIYSHVSKKNPASLSLHKKCGFKSIKDYAVYSDGSILHSHITLTLNYEKSEI